MNTKPLEPTKHLPRVALVRGAALSSYEMQCYELLRDRYLLEAFALERTTSDLSAIKIPYHKLRWADSIFGRSLFNACRSRVMGQRYYMPGLERRLHGFSLVHSSELTTTFSWQVARLRKKLGCHLVVTSTENIPSPGWEDDGSAVRKSEVIKNADCFLALTPDARDVLLGEGIPESLIRIVPFGLDLERFKPGDPDPLWAGRFGLRSADFVILYAGRFVWEKGIYDLLNAVRKMDLKDLKVLLVGDGPEKALLKRYARALHLESRVVFTPAIPYGEIDKIHRLADVLVLPSIPVRGVREQFGLVLAEAMACGIPVVASRCGSMPWVIGDAGLLSNPGDASSLAVALNTLRESPELRTRLGRQGRALAEERYDRRNVSETIHQAYQFALRGER